MRFLRMQLDDPVLDGPEADCGRCDNCDGLSLDTSVSAEAVEEAGARLSRPGVPIEPRKLWPTGMATLGIELKGKISEAADEGRAVARLTDLGHGQALRGLFRPDTPDGQVPAPLVQAVLTMLDDWRPEVDAIVVVESFTRPTLTDDLAGGLSRRLQVPVVGRWAIVDPDVAPGQGSANSAQRVAAVGRRATLRADVPPDARVLLVDDLVVTGWTLTLAARAVRNAGAAAVLPLTLAVQS
jgi:ATP-dependent DNA helicase RecQ